MATITFEAEQKNFGSPFVVAFDSIEDKILSRSSVMLNRKTFKASGIPKKIRVTVEWSEEDR